MKFQLSEFSWKKFNFQPWKFSTSSLTGAEDRPPGRTGASFRNVAVVSRRAGLMFFKQVVVVIAAAADDAKLFRGQSHTSMEDYIDTESESESE